MKELSGKRAFITGAARGIGAAIAIELAEKGADIAFSYVRSGDAAEELAREIEGLGVKAFPIQADSADSQAVTRSVHEAARLLGGLDILVNNAGVAFICPLEAMQLDQIDQIIAVNIRAVILASQAAITYLGEGGRIINIGSCLAERVAFESTRSIPCPSPPCSPLHEDLLVNWGRKASPLILCILDLRTLI